MPNTLRAQYGGELRAIAIGDAARQLNELRQRDPPLDHVERVPEVVCVPFLTMSAAITQSA